MVKDKAAEAEWKYLDINEHRQQMKNIMMETAQATCWLSKSPCRHKETWWWKEEVAEAVREKKKKYRNWKKEKTIEAWKEYKKSKQNAKKSTGARDSEWQWHQLGHMQRLLPSTSCKVSPPVGDTWVHLIPHSTHRQSSSLYGYIAMPHAKWTRPFHVLLAAQCPQQTSPISQPRIQHIHNVVPVPHST